MRNPVEGTGLLIAVDAIPDIFATALNVTGDMVAGLPSSRVSTQLRTNVELGTRQ